MQIIIEDNSWLRLAQLFDVQEAAIAAKFRAKDPNARYSKAMRTGHWDGYVCRYEKSSQRLSKAFLNDLIELCRVNNFPYEIHDSRNKSTFPPPAEGSYDKNLLVDITLEDYQMRAIQATCKNNILSEIGIIDVTTGGGKGELIAATVKLFRCPTVIITEQTIVLDQIASRLRLRKVVHNDDIGMFCSGKTPDDNLVIVGSINSMQTPTKPERKKIKIKKPTLIKEFGALYDEYLENKNNEEYLKQNGTLPKIIGIQNLKIFESTNDISDSAFALFSAHLVNIFYERSLKAYHTMLYRSQIIQQLISKCEMLIMDEVDRSSSDLYIQLFKVFKGRYRFGYSATPFDKAKPVESLKIRERFGSTLIKIEREEVEAAGRIQPIVYYMLQHGKYEPHDKSTFDIAEKDNIINNVEFHEKIKKIIASFPNEGIFILVDTSNIEILGKKLEEILPGSVFIYNKTARKKRNEAISAFERRDIKILIASKILKRGFDLKSSTENLILIGGGKQWSNFNQIIGRALRLSAKGESRIFDFYFTGNKYLLDHSRKRLKFMNEMGYHSTVVINGKKIDGREFVRTRYRYM